MTKKSRAEPDNPVLVWLRQDLRLGDNPALRAACDSGRPVLCVFILDDEAPGRWRIGGASRSWLHHSLSTFAAQIEKRGGVLVLRRGRASEEIARLAQEVEAAALYWNRCYEPFAVARDAAIKAALSEKLEVRSFSAALLHEPWEVRTKVGEPFKVFTPYWRQAQQTPHRALAAAPKRISGYAGAVASDRIEDWALTPRSPNWAEAFEGAPGEAGAHDALEALIEQKLALYPDARDHMAIEGTSRLSAHLHWGEISPVQIKTRLEACGGDEAGASKFMSEIGWREFSHHLLFHEPRIAVENWRSAFDAFPWRDDAEGLRAWQRGQTGYPIVDAAMQQLWRTGWMHNRARMIVASFLVKHLLIDWRRGADWFWDTLTDADLANNSASWQWVAGSGADAAPYFRIFNPITQGERYDAAGAYVRRWLPELAHLPNAVIHQPFEAPEAILRAAGVRLGETYPLPIVDHKAARERALAAFAAIKSAG